MLHILHWKKRPLVYALVVTVGFAFLLTILENLPADYFFMAAGIIYLVLLFELYSTVFYASRLLDQFQLPPVDDKDKLPQLIHHLVLPTVIYLGLVIFLFFNHQHSLNLFFIILVFVIFSVLFTNIRAFYEDKFKLEAATHNIYDFLMLIISYIATDAVLNIFSFAQSSVVMIIFFTGLVLLLLGALVLLRYHLYSGRNMVILTVLILVYSVVTGLLINLGLNISVVALISTLEFYYLLAYYNHVLDNSLSGKVITEYILVFLIIITFLYGIN